MSPATQKSPREASPSRRPWLLIIPILGGVFLLLIAVVLILLLKLLGPQPLLFRDETNTGMPLEVVKVTPTIPVSPLPPPSCETIISSGDVQMAVPLPISLTVGGESFPVEAIVLDGKGWTYPTGYPGTAAWICGTVVNYVVGLEPTPENKALLVGLRPGDEIKLRLSNDAVLIFRFAQQGEVAANDAGVFEQFKPRLTMILEKEDGTWRVATADYVSETEPVQPSSGTLAQPGQQVRVGNAQVTVIRGHAERSRPELLSGTMYYLVEFSVENAGAEPLDANAIAMQLQDGVGNWYLLSSAASAAGDHGPLGGEIAPGATVSGTAGYLVPETLAGPTLLWTFSPVPGSELRANVSIPYETETAPAGHAEVTITDAFLNSGNDVLMIEGEVRNTGGQPFTVEVGYISLSSSAGMSELRMAAPPLPWTIQPGQIQVIELQYAKPNAPTALLSLLGYSFEIQGLQ